MKSKNYSRFLKWSNKNGLQIAGLLFAFFAFLFSIKSCSDSNKALNISETQSEAFLQITNVELIESIDSASFIEVKLTLKNLGQVPARNVKAEFDYSLENGDFEKNGNSITRKDIGSIGQGFEKNIILKSNGRNMRMWKINRKLPDVLNFYGTVFYKDNLSNDIEKKIDWCYELKLENEQALQTKELIQSESNKFKSSYRLSNQ